MSSVRVPGQSVQRQDIFSSGVCKHCSTALCTQLRGCLDVFWLRNTELVFFHWGRLLRNLRVRVKAYKGWLCSPTVYLRQIGGGVKQRAQSMSTFFQFFRGRAWLHNKPTMLTCNETANVFPSLRAEHHPICPAGHKKLHFLIPFRWHMFVVIVPFFLLSRPLQLLLRKMHLH